MKRKSRLLFDCGIYELRYLNNINTKSLLIIAKRLITWAVRGNSRKEKRGK